MKGFNWEKAKPLKSEISEKKLVHTVEVMEHLKSGIGSIFETVQCSPDAMKANLGDQSSVNASNVLQYLAEIESKTNELVQQYMLLSMTSTEVNCMNFMLFCNEQQHFSSAWQNLAKLDNYVKLTILVQILLL